MTLDYCVGSASNRDFSLKIVILQAKKHLPIKLAPATGKVVKQFADLLSTVAEAAADSKISAKEASNIPREWERLKRAAEGYVKCCEEGNFKQLNRDLNK